MSAKKKQPEAEALGELVIAIHQGGWVYVGYRSVDHAEHRIVLRRAHNIRRWGTSRGLGELRGGPLPNTVLDDYGTVQCHPLQEIATLHDLDADAWAKVLT